MKSRTTVQIILVVGLLFLFGTIAWSFGWVARVAFSELGDNRVAPAPTVPPTTSVPEIAAPTPTTAAATRTPTPVLAESSPPPTSTPRPTRAASPTPEIRTYRVRRGQGWAIIAGDVCPELVSYADRMSFAEEIIAHNPGVGLYEGVELEIPPCSGD